MCFDIFPLPRRKDTNYLPLNSVRLHYHSRYLCHDHHLLNYLLISNFTANFVIFS
ncbi:hypothetical protein C0J52_20082 [Blattella germanica]|nr:hypothetical protein C0J52_20082 [Blattella germanica]